MNAFEREKHGDGGGTQARYDFDLASETDGEKAEYHPTFEAYPQVLPDWLKLLKDEPLGGYPPELRKALGLPEYFVGSQIEGWDLLRLIAKKEMIIDPLPKSFYDFDVSVQALRADMRQWANRHGKLLTEMDLNRMVRTEMERFSADDLKELGACKVDLHMGTKYQHYARTNVSSVRIGEPLPLGILIEGELTPSDQLILQTGELINASTVEYLLLPDYMRGSMDGRSGNARKGLVVETASLFDPGFEGNGTMELSNLGPVPIDIRSGDTICAMDFLLLSSPAKHPYRGKFYRQQKPQGGRNE